MLTADLVRATVRQGVLHPKWVDLDRPELLGLAETILTTFSQGVGDTVRELDEAVLAATSDHTDVLLTRGLAKLCWDASTTESPLLPTRSDPSRTVTPQVIRETLFALAASSWPVRPLGGDGFTSREDVIARAADALDLTPEALERGLYADLGSAQHLLNFETITPRELLDRYNLALAQSCLLRAREVRVTLTGLEPKRAQALLRALKFRRILFRYTPQETNALITLDGPLSLFKQTSRYGLQLALFLPELLRCERFSLEADLRWGRSGQAARDVVLRLSERSPLRPTGRDKGTWTSAEEDHFQKSFEALDTPWTLARTAEFIDLDGRDALIPDYVLTHRDGRRAYLELVFSWRLEAFKRRLALLAEAGPSALVIALAERGEVDEAKGALMESLHIYRFKGVIQPKRVLELAEKVATVHTPIETRVAAPEAKPSRRARPKPT